MAYQMIYTSIKSGLVAGRSGFCTAARHREISEALVGRIENLSGQYDRGSAATRQGGALPVIYSHRIVGIRGREWHLLMRIGDAGNDYSGRTNHIAHTYVFEPEEVARIGLTPAEMILYLIREGRWSERYTEAARFFETKDILDPGGRPTLVGLPAKHWERMTGVAANAAHLFDPKATMGAGLVNPDGNRPDDLLHLLAESQLLASPDRSKPAALWTRSFTTLMQSTEQRGDFDWYGCDYNGPVHMQMLKADRCLIEIAKGLAAPSGRYADLAEGRAVAVEERASVRMEAGSGEASIRPSAALPGAGPVLLPASPLPPLELGGAKRGKETKKKSGVPAWIWAVGGLCLIGLLAAAVLMFLGGGEAEKFARENFAALENGADWSEVETKLEKLDASERERYKADHPAFAALERSVRLAEKYRWILDHAQSTPVGQAPGGDGVGTIEDYEIKTQKEWASLAQEFGRKEVGLPTPAFLARLKTDAEAKIEGRREQHEAIAKAWEGLAKLKPGDASDLISRLGSSVDSDPSEFGRSARDLRDAIPIVEGFAKLKADKLTTEEQLAAAEKKKADLETRIGDLANRAGEGAWSKPLNRLYATIGSYTPKVDVSGKPDPNLGKEPEKPVTTVPTETNETEKKIAIPPTFFRKVTADSKYDLSGVAPLSEAIPKGVYLTPRHSFRADELAGLVTKGLFIKPNLYHEDTKTTTVFQVTSGKTLEPTSKMPVDYGKGFFLAFANASNSPPEFQIVAQKASGALQTAPADAFFLDLPLDRALSKNGGTIGLTEEAKGLLSQFRFAGTGAVYHLLWTQGSGSATSMASGNEPGSLTADLATGIEAAIAQAKAKADEYAGQKEIGQKFATIFGNLGETLFCNPADGKRWLWTLKIDPVKNQNGMIVGYSTTPVEEKEVSGGSAFYKTLAEYEAKGTDGRPALIGYVNYSLYDVYRDHASSNRSTLTPEEKQFIEDHFQKVTNPDGWGPVGIENALQAWLKITERSAEKGMEWHKLPPIDGELSQEAAEDRKDRYPTNRFRAEFFRQWQTVFTAKNVDVARQFLLGGEFKQEELDKLKANLETLERQRAGVAAKPLAELGQFHIVVQSGTDYFRILKLSPPGAP